MIPSIHTLETHRAGKLKGIFFDLDDTFTTRGKITVSAFKALWAIKENGLKAVPITGRPAGWCDHIARMWPVDGVIGENGAFYFWYDEPGHRLRKRFLDTREVRAEKRRRLSRIKDEILNTVRGTALASDQAYRETDLAIDFCEDVAPLVRSEIDRICNVFKKHGASCRISSIHVNGWFGDYTKIGMTKTLVAEQWGLDLDRFKDRFLFCGDSPNDEPLFHYFPVSAGVQNVRRFIGEMRHLPAYLSGHEGGEGFVEIVNTVMEKRQTT